ncbi:MAG: tripartite tricarboxylate transporter substrate binding protein [Paracraurococcus sp.]
MTEATAGGAAADWAPPGPIRLVVPFAAGGGNDRTARLIAPGLGAALGRPVTVENHSGASGMLGAGLVARAAPDGTTLLVDGENQVTAPFLLRQPGLDYRDAFAPISRLILTPLVLVLRAESRFDSLAALLDRARMQPGRFSYASAGNAVANHVAAALLASRAGVSVTHSPFRGGAPALQAILSGEADFGFTILVAALPPLRQGRLRALAISTAARSPVLPAVPTVAEQGFPGYDQCSWSGLFGPAGLPAAAIERLNAACREALGTAETQRRLAASGASSPLGPPEAFRAFLQRERTTMQALVETAQIRAE